jgi:molybdopterin-guanine dinucleotide biosynthesis protein A
MSKALPPVALARLGGCVLAGGRGSRMQGVDKGLVEVRGEPLAALVLAQLRPQVSHLFINANRNLARYQALGVPVMCDLVDGFAGPLAGMHAVLKQAKDCDAMLFVPCDAPTIAPDLALRLCHALPGRHAALARVSGRLQPTFSLLRTSDANMLAEALARGERKLESMFTSLDAAPVDFDDCPQCFLNLNSSDQVAAYFGHAAPHEP